MMLLSLVCAAELQGLLQMEMEYAYPALNLYLTDPGFENPGLSQGLLGFVNNPAGLAFLEAPGGIALASLPSSSVICGQMSVDPADYNVDYITDTLVFPCEFTGSEKANMDYAAAGVFLGRAKDWVLGVAITRGDFVGLNGRAQLGGSVQDSISFSDTLDSGDIPDLPVDVVIPANFLFEAQGQASITASGQASFASMPITIAVARRGNSTGWAYGFALRLTPMWTSAKIAAILSGGVSGEALISAQAGSDWTVNAQFTGEFQSDSLARYYFDGTGSSITPCLVAGLIWKNQWLSLGASLETGASGTVSGQWDQFALYPWDTVYWEIQGDSLIVDTANKRITGKGKLIITGFGQDTVSSDGLVQSIISRSSGLKLGGSLFLGKLGIGMTGGATTTDDASYFRANFGTGLFTLTALRVGLSVSGYWQFYNIGGFPVSPPPAVAAGLSASFPVKNARFYLATRASSTSLITALTAAMFASDITGGSSAKYASVGLGMKMTFGEVQ